LAKARAAVIRTAVAYVAAEQDDRATAKRRARLFQELMNAVTDHELIEIAHLGTLTAAERQNYHAGRQVYLGEPDATS
jgi:hypothetical protein